jgi:hypothetical protein
MTEETKMILDKLEKMDNKITGMDTKITDVQLTLENVTNRNIKIIAEGHRDLTRKLDDALKVDNEKEMLLIRVNYLENEMRQVKERLAEMV